jgi:hypothetical protein
MVTQVKLDSQLHFMPVDDGLPPGASEGLLEGVKWLVADISSRIFCLD